MRVRAALILFSVLAGLGRAEEPATTVTLMGVAGTTSGDQGRRDDHDGFRNGVAAKLEHRSKSIAFSFNLEPTTAGWLDLRTTSPSPWKLRLQLDRTRRYSDDSVRPELTPGGTPVSSLYPNSNTLSPAFGDVQPVLNRTRWRVGASYSMDRAQVDVLVRGVDLSGQRTPEAGGIAFGDANAMAFFTPALESEDSSEVEVGASARFDLLGLGWRAQVSRGSRTAETSTRFPAFGASSLIDTATYSEKHDADFTTAGVSAVYAHEGVTVVGGASHAKVESAPSYSGKTSAAGTVDALTHAGASYQSAALAASASWRAGAAWTFRVSARRSSSDSDSHGTETHRSKTYALSRTEEADDWRAEAQVSYGRGALRTSLLGSRERVDRSVSRSRGESFRLEEPRDTRDAVRAEASLRLGRDVKARAYYQRQWETLHANVIQLVSDYATGDRESTLDIAGASVTGHIGRAPVSVVVQGSHGAMDLEPPVFDPVTDTSWQLQTALVETDCQSVLVRAASPGGSALSLWGELGWRRQKWNYVDTVVFPGYADVDEEVRGATGAAGLDWTPTPDWTIRGSAWLDAPSRTVQHSAVRVEAGVERRINDRFAAVAAVLYRRFNEKIYQLDDYTLLAFSAGVSGRF